VIKVGIECVLGFLDEGELRGIDTQKALDEMKTLDESGWVNLPADYNAGLSAEIKGAAAKINGQSEAL